MVRTKVQMQRIQMRMKLPLKHDTCYAQHFTKVNSEPCKAGGGAFSKTVNDFKPLKTVVAKRSVLGIWQGSEHASSIVKLYIWKGGGFLE